MSLISQFRNSSEVMIPERLFENVYTEKNSSRNFAQLLTKVGSYRKEGDHLILL